MAAQGIGPVVSSVRLFGEFDYAARSWPQAHRVVLKAEVLAGNNGLPAKDSHPFAVQDCRTCQTVQRPGAATPIQRLSGQGATGKICQRLVSARRKSAMLASP